MENWFSNMAMKGTDNSFNEKHPTLIGHCSNSVPHAANATHGKNKRVRSSWEIQGHIMSERKRRQEMAERFIQLSAMIPGLKKIDKVSVLGEAINYVKELKERISMLEQQYYERNKSTKSIISIRKFQSHPLNDNLDSNHVLPEVEAIGIESEKELLLIKINCEKREGILFKLLSMLENMHLYVSTSSVLPFGKNTLNITIIAKMGEEYRITIEELMTKLKQDLLKLYDM
ncbi:transcription factor bHLH25 [Medicago truncatula]|uniref:Helix loop helix DNA-binding domain protein n=2 Tax=Medicago truncatula TaxID=3880 RepID=G7IMB4_MEDTR|nr:transcription factor bHLH25 [Medicago truncatula]AES68224.1 helix loop helix DNA-binding domain protein [Medicago truncatula]